MNTTTDIRFDDLIKWTGTLTTVNLACTTIEALQNDASFRRYFRVKDTTNRTYILMDSPPDKEDVTLFIKMARLFKQSGVVVPDIFAQEEKAGFLLLSDLGTLDLLSACRTESSQTIQLLYQRALDNLLNIQQKNLSGNLAPYDKTMQRSELDLFKEWYICAYHGYQLNPSELDQLEAVFQHIVNCTLAQPFVCVHRDYQSRNLMVLPNHAIGVLDFQGAVYGPVTYDIVSLLKDAYIQWEEDIILDYVVKYWKAANRLALPVSSRIDDFYRDVEWMGLQRHLKILGIFCRLHLRDHKSGYLHYLPTVLSYVRAVAARYQALTPLLYLLDSVEKKTTQTGYTF